MEKKLVKLTSALLGIIDPDYEIGDDYLKNKQFMEKGQSIIEEIDDDKQNMEKQREEENIKKMDEEVKKAEEEVKKN